MVVSVATYIRVLKEKQLLSVQYVDVAQIADLDSFDMNKKSGGVLNFCVWGGLFCFTQRGFPVPCTPVCRHMVYEKIEVILLCSAYLPGP